MSTICVSCQEPLQGLFYKHPAQQVDQTCKQREGSEEQRASELPGALPGHTTPTRSCVPLPRPCGPRQAPLSACKRRQAMQTPWTAAIPGPGCWPPPFLCSPPLSAGYLATLCAPGPLHPPPWCPARHGPGAPPAVDCAPSSLVHPFAKTRKTHNCADMPPQAHKGDTSPAPQAPGRMGR
jgi:hypothetical protein